MPRPRHRVGVDRAGRDDRRDGVVRHGDDHGVGLVRAVVEHDRAVRPRDFTAAPSSTRTPARSSAAVAASPCRRCSGTAGTPMSHASAASSSPVRKTIVASSERSLVGRQVERRQRDQVPELVRSPRRTGGARAATSPKVCSSSDGVRGIERRAAPRRREARSARSRRLERREAERASARGGAARAAARGAGTPAACPRGGSARAVAAGSGRGARRRGAARKPRYAVQQRSSTCWPLSIQWSLRRTEYVAPPSRVRASNSVTLAPWSARSSAAAIPARPPPTTATRAPFTPRSARGSARARGPSPSGAASAGRCSDELGMRAMRSSSRRYAPAIASTHAALRRSRSGTSVSPSSSRSSARCASNATSSSAGPSMRPSVDAAAEAVEILGSADSGGRCAGPR